MQGVYQEQCRAAYHVCIHVHVPEHVELRGKVSFFVVILAPYLCCRPVRAPDGIV